MFSRSSCKLREAHSRMRQPMWHQMSGLSSCAQLKPVELSVAVVFSISRLSHRFEADYTLPPSPPAGLHLICESALPVMDGLPPKPNCLHCYNVTIAFAALRKIYVLQRRMLWVGMLSSTIEMFPRFLLVCPEHRN